MSWRCGNVLPEMRGMWSHGLMAHFCVRPEGHSGKHRTARREWSEGARFSLPRENVAVEKSQPDGAQNDAKLLDFCLREAETAIRMMFRDGTIQHAFNLGTNQETGERLVFVMTILPEDLFDAQMKARGLHTHDLKPLTVEKSQPAQGQHPGEAKP